MKFELIKDATDLERYGDIPCLPVDVDFRRGERFVGDEKDSWILLDDFVVSIDAICPNELDYGDVDFFNKDDCVILNKWLQKRMEQPMSDRLTVLYSQLKEYLSRAIELGTGVVIGL